jgi:hypothetical protein
MFDSPSKFGSFQSAIMRKRRRLYPFVVVKVVKGGTQPNVAEAGNSSKDRDMLLIGSARPTRPIRHASRPS